MAIPLDQIGGAYVRRPFTQGSRQRMPGETLSAEEVKAIPRVNRDALINLKKLECWPAAPKQQGDTNGRSSTEQRPHR